MPIGFSSGHLSSVFGCRGAHPPLAAEPTTYSPEVVSHPSAIASRRRLVCEHVRHRGVDLLVLGRLAEDVALAPAWRLLAGVRDVHAVIGQASCVSARCSGR
jgi:hypothetical protein